MATSRAGITWSLRGGGQQGQRQTRRGELLGDGAEEPGRNLVGERSIQRIGQQHAHGAGRAPGQRAGGRVRTDVAQLLGGARIRSRRIVRTSCRRESLGDLIRLTPTRRPASARSPSPSPDTASAPCSRRLREPFRRRGWRAPDPRPGRPAGARSHHCANLCVRGVPLRGLDERHHRRTRPGTGGLPLRPLPSR